jgi:hypothetical protein
MIETKQGPFVFNKFLLPNSLGFPVYKGGLCFLFTSA